MNASRRGVRRMDLLWVAVSAMVGSGWMLGPLYAAQIAGPSAIFSWLIGGFLVLLSAFSFAELSAMLPLPGGISRFPQLSHGTWVGFTMSWIAWLSLMAIPVIEIQGLVQYSANYLPFLTVENGGHSVLSVWGTLTCAGLLILLAFVNITRVDNITHANSKLSYFKILVPLITVAVFCSTQGHYDNLSSHQFFQNGWTGVLAALPAGVAFSYFGFNLAISLAREVDNPQKAMPFALIGSLLLCTILYMLIQFAFIIAIPPELLSHGWDQLSFHGQAGPFVGLALLVGLIPLSILLYTAAFFSPLGSAMVTMASTGRMQLGMSLIGYFPAYYQKLNSKGAPQRAIFLNLTLGLVMLLPFPGWREMVEFIFTGLVFSHAFAPLSLVAFRKQIPEQYRPFRLPFYAFFSFASFAVMNLMTYWCGWNTIWKMDVALAVGYTFLLIRRLRPTSEEKPVPLHLQYAHWVWAYLALIAVFSYLGHFGGGIGLIPKPWDSIGMVLGSLVIFLWAAHARRPEQDVAADLQHVFLTEPLELATEVVVDD